MTLELVVAIISLITSTIIGIWQVYSSKKQKSINKELRVEIKNLKISKTTQIRGIVGNSNDGNISYNNL
jgi:hypothetical protein